MHGRPELVDTLLKAYHRGCPVADASLDLVALLTAGENRIGGHHNHNILTAEHVVSALSRQRDDYYGDIQSNWIYFVRLYSIAKQPSYLH